MDFAVDTAAMLELSHLKDPAEIEAVMAAGLGQPIAVYYDDTRLVLRPDFAVDTAAMLAEAQQYLDGPDFVDIALRKLAGIPQQRRDIPARYSYDAQKLATWLWRAGEELNHPPQPGRVLPPQWNWRTEGGMREAGEEEGGERGRLTAYATLPATFVGAAQRSWQWTSGTVGQTLLIDESAQSILDALGSMDARTAHLALQESPPPPLTMAELGRELNAYTSRFPRIRRYLCAGPDNR